ncbi:thiol peroxidase [Photobacterium alginatilyticum]|uniref:Thiol peroxidase n=1 Tax=Photobacterium alginatilyticum TaxID=1775171 RepID=A0ABW9YCB9_9GAMM|nr:thiol peroxidase [Photobacterium alginatilyticum]NBI51302.1 thiol peroxidase [Photobacterium alginatilyticum]
MNYYNVHDATINVLGDFPCAGQETKQFTLVKDDFNIITHSELYGKRCVLYSFLSVDMPVCAESVREFNRLAYRMKDIEVVCISVDTPFTLNRFCQREGLDYITTASCFSSSEFSLDFGVKIDNPMFSGFTARAVLCLNEHGLITHSQIIKDINHPPDYDSVISALCPAID